MIAFELMTAELPDLRSQAWAEKIQLGLMQFNQSKHSFDFAPLRIFASEKGALLGGLIATTGWSWLNIDLLFVEQHARRRGIAKALLEMAEQKARILGCIGAYVDTFDFQAPEFYQTQGFSCLGILEDMPPGHRRYYLKKRFVKSTQAQQEPVNAT